MLRGGLVRELVRGEARRRGLVWELVLGVVRELARLLLPVRQLGLQVWWLLWKLRKLRRLRREPAHDEGSRAELYGPTRHVWRERWWRACVRAGNAPAR